MYGSKQYTETATTFSKPIPSRKRSIHTKPIVQAVMKRVKQNPRRSMRKTASQLEISRSSMHKICKNDLMLTAYKKAIQDSYFHQLPSRNGKTEAKRCWRMCSAPSTMSFYSPMIRSSLWRQLPSRRMMDCMHVMQKICLKVVVPIYVV